MNISRLICQKQTRSLSLRPKIDVHTKEYTQYPYLIHCYLLNKRNLHFERCQQSRFISSYLLLTFHQQLLLMQQCKNSKLVLKITNKK